MIITIQFLNPKNIKFKLIGKQIANNDSLLIIINRASHHIFGNYLSF